MWSDYEDYQELPPTSITTLSFDYSDPSSPTKYADSESMFLDHTGWGGGTPGDIYIATKWDGNAKKSFNRLFQIPVLAWE